MRNYDTTNGKPYPRVSRIEIDFAEDGSINGVYHQRTAVVIDGKVMYIDNPAEECGFTYSLADYAITAPLVAPSTGADMGGNVTVGQTLVSILALIRRDQKLRDGG